LLQSAQADLLGAVADDQRLVFGPAAADRHDTQRDTRQDLEHYHARNQFDPRVAALRAHPGFDARILCHLVTELGYRGMIVEGYGDGGLPGDDGSEGDGGETLVSAVQKVTAGGAIVCVTSSVLGPASLQLYAGGKSLIEAGAIPLQDMTTECAIVKLMWSLACAQTPAAARTVMTQNLADVIHVTA
jgi:L-asparaginase/Glu-tRNA(Gln) amidotransferase subunit D